MFYTDPSGIQDISKGLLLSPLWAAGGSGGPYTAAPLKQFKANKSLIFCFSIMRD